VATRLKLPEDDLPSETIFTTLLLASRRFAKGVSPY
jgi:hypothetical protein